MSGDSDLPDVAPHVGQQHRDGLFDHPCTASVQQFLQQEVGLGLQLAIALDRWMGEAAGEANANQE